MGPKDIIKAGKASVRNSATLYPLYQKLFQEAFGFIPDCPTCGSVNGHKHWEAFTAFADGKSPNTLLIQNNISMANTEKTFEVKNKSKLYSYNFKKKGQDRVFTNRNYGDIMTEEFAIAYLDSAADNPELLNLRKAEFSKLPDIYSDNSGLAPAINQDKSNLKFTDLQKLAEDAGYPKTEWEKLRSKADMSAYLEAKKLTVDPADVDPADVDPADVDPADVDPADVDPADVDPADVDPLV